MVDSPTNAAVPPAPIDPNVTTPPLALGALAIVGATIIPTSMLQSTAKPTTPTLSSSLRPYFQIKLSTLPPHSVYSILFRRHHSPPRPQLHLPTNLWRRSHHCRWAPNQLVLIYSQVDQESNLLLLCRPNLHWTTLPHNDRSCNRMCTTLKATGLLSCL